MAVEPLAVESQQQPAENPLRALMNIDVEQALLGAAMTRNEIFDMVGSSLEPGHFSEPVHARIYEVSLALLRQGVPVTAITLKQWFERDESLQQIGGIEYLISLMRGTVTLVNAPQYAKLIRDLYVRRQLVLQAEDIIDRALSMAVDESVNTVCAEAAEDIVKLSAHTGTQRIVSLYEASDAALVAMQKRMNGDKDESLIRTGIPALDDHVGGLARGELAIIGGRPGMGKSALADMLAYLAARNGYVTLLWTGEMRFQAVSERILTAAAYPRGAIQYSRASTGKIGLKEFERLCAINTEEFTKLPLMIDDRPKVTVGHLRTAAAKARLKFGTLDLIVVDYIGLMGSTNRQLIRTIDVITDISASLKELARDLNVPVIALHQLNRDPEKRDNKRPQLSDLRESGAVEQDADTVWFAFREEYYLREELKTATGADLLKIQDRLRECQNRMEIIIAKLRRGPTGTIKVFCDIGSNFIGPMPIDQENML
jgi:replicative DNA helicase